nr:MAG TPA: repressor domain protein [Caudoviricetes sp.]
MNNSLRVFDNEEFGTIRTVMIDGEPWFVGKDVAEALGYTNPRDALSKHVDDEDKKTVAIRDGIRGNPNVTVINESGVYSLILSSKLPNAKKFKRWVTAEILPSVRQTGSYSAKPMTLAEQALAQAQILVDHEKQLAELSESVDKLERFNDGIVAVLAPTAVSDGWQEQMNRKVRQYCLDYDLDYRVAFNQLYMTVESSTRSDLTRRVENRRKRILQNGGTRAEADKVTKLSVIANDAALRNAFDLALKNMCVASYARHGDEVGV